MNLGNAYFSQNRYKEAVYEYEKALTSGVSLPAIERRIREIRDMERK